MDIWEKRKIITFNSQYICVPFLNSRGLQFLYSFSYLYFGAMATSTVVLVGLVVSYVIGEMRHKKMLMHSDKFLKNP